MAHQLASFHAAFWAKTGELPPGPWSRWEPDNAATIQRAYRDWQALQAQPHLTGLLLVGQLQWIAELLPRLGGLTAIREALPLTLCHGDCNPGNVLGDVGGSLRWIDWQEVGIGCGPEDLAFFLQQSTVAGAAVPAEEALAVYQAQLERETGEVLRPGLLQRVVDAAELRSRTLDWPTYLAQAPEQEVARMLERIRELVDRLGI